MRVFVAALAMVCCWPVHAQNGTAGASFAAGRPQMLWERFYAHGLSSACGAPGPSSSKYDATPDRQRFLMIKENEQDGRYTRIHVVLSGAEELKRLMQEKERKKS